jgi:hypothetical protein
MAEADINGLIEAFLRADPTYLATLVHGLPDFSTEMGRSLIRAGAPMPRSGRKTSPRKW